MITETGTVSSGFRPRQVAYSQATDIDAHSLDIMGIVGLADEYRGYGEVLDPIRPPPAHPIEVGAVERLADNGQRKSSTAIEDG